MIYCQKLVSSLDVAKAKQFTVQDFQTVNLGSQENPVREESRSELLCLCTMATDDDSTRNVRLAITLRIL